MFTKVEIEERIRRGAVVMVLGVSVGMALCFAYLFSAPLFRDRLLELARRNAGEIGETVALLSMIAPCFLLFLGPALWAERYVKRFAFHCPLCGVDLTRSSKSLLATLRCRSCKAQIVKGARARSFEAYERYARLHSRVTERWTTALVCWMWPISCLFVHIAYWIDSDANLKLILLATLCGVVVPCYAFLRTGERRFLAPLFASLLIGGFTIAWLWREFWA